jgi:hypothetical protein
MPLNVPGVYVTESTYGSIPAILNTHDAVYVIGSSSQSGAPTNTPTFCADMTSFTNVFGASPSAAAVQLFFNQRSGFGIYFINVLKRVERTMTATSATVGTVTSVVIDGYTISYTAVTGDTVTTIRDNLGALVNTQLPLTASYYKADGTLRYNSGLTVTAGTNLTLGTATTVGSVLIKDVSDAINIAFEPGMRQGFICAPEFFQSFTSLTDRTFLQSSMEALASNPDYNMVAVIDPGLATATQTTGAGAINLAIAERNTFTSPKGHSWYYFPYFKDVSNVNVPPSLAVIGVALRRMRAETFAQPAAGTNYPVYGVTDVTFKVTETIQSQLNPVGINCVRKLPRGRGIVVYGARTLSTSNYYKFGSVRVILNVLASSLADAFDPLIFTLVDGTGVLFSRIRQTAAAYCELLRLQGALYGATASEAYLVICDSTNNTADNLEAGQVSVDVIVKPSPTMEVLRINISRASLGTVLAEVQSSGNTNSVLTSTNTSSTSPAA